MIPAMENWQRISGPNRLPKVIEGTEFRDGINRIQAAVQPGAQIESKAGAACILSASQSPRRVRIDAVAEDMDFASITIRNLDDEVKTRLRTRAAGNGRSMEDEVRRILRGAVGREAEPKKLAAVVRE